MKALGYNYIEQHKEQISEGYEIAEKVWKLGLVQNSVQFKNGLIIVSFLKLL